MVEVCCLKEVMAGFPKMFKLITEYDYLDFINFTGIFLLKTNSKTKAKTSKNERKNLKKMFCNCDVLILKIISLRSIINPITVWSNKVAIDRDVNRAIPNIYNEVFCENSYRLKAVNYFLKKAPS